MRKKMTQKERLLKAFTTRKRGLTTGQIANTLNVSPSRARFLVSELRNEGEPIFRNTYATNGVLGVRYNLGKTKPFLYI